MRGLVGVIASLAVVGTLVVVAMSPNRGHVQAGWKTQHLAGKRQLKGEVPLPVSQKVAAYVRPHAQKAVINLNFGFPLRDRAALDKLIAQQAKTHSYLSRDELYTRFSPPNGQIDALRTWLQTNGFTVTHVGLDRMAVTASATTATVQKALHVKINDYIRPAFQFHAVKVTPFVFYSNTSDPTLPARLGVQTISGLSDVDRFFTQAQLECGDDNAVINPLCIDVRAGGYFPVDLRGLYNITGHGVDGSGQTIGFTLWTAAERQATMNAFATNTGDQLITIDPNCIATGNSPTVPSSCTTQTVAGDHLLFILENGNLDNNFGSNVETALDIEAAHGVATHVGMKYYAADCATTTPPGSGLTNAGCNGSDVGLEETIEDAANDPTLHSVSNSWAFGGEAEWGAVDPFLVTAENSLTIAAAAGTTFYFSTGDSGTYESGYPSDSPHVVGVGGTSTYSTSTPATWSTSTMWSGGGSWCSNVIARPSWQTGSGVTANAPCAGRVIPDVSAISDPATGVRFTSTSNATGGTQSGQVGGTSLGAPVMNGLQAVTQNFVNAQTYPGATPSMGFVAPVLYQMGNSGNYASYFRDIDCGNSANPTSGPDGDAATKGWDAATGWGEPDWFNFSIGYAMTLGATNLSVPASLSRSFAWSCAKTPSNSTERSISFPTTSTGYAVGSPSGGTPWYGKFIPGGSWGAVNTFFKSTAGGKTWFPSNSDMFSITCTSSSTCVEVGAGGRERMTTDSGSTWSDVPTAPGNNKPLTQVTCPSSSICYAVGDRGNAMKSTDGGLTWSWQYTTDGNPLYGLSCPSTTTCYATDIYAHVLKTSDSGLTWTWQQTPITTPGLAVPGSGGPNPFAGLMAISCPDPNTCVASGLYVVPSGQTIPSIDPPIVTTTDGGLTWVRQTSSGGAAVATSTTLSAATAVGATNIKVASVSGFVAGQPIVVESGGANPETVTITTVGTAGAGGTGVDVTPALTFAHASGATVGVSFAPNYLHGISCLPGTTKCTAVGRGGAIVTTTNLTTWTKVASGTTNMLNSVTCLSASFCMASGQNGTIDVWNGTSWTATTGNGGGVFLADVTCLDPSTCYATGRQGVTIATTDGGAHWAQQAGGGTTLQMNSVSCPSANACFAVGVAGTILATVNGGQTWLPQTSGTAVTLNGVSCASTTACVAVGATASGPTTLAAASAAGATNIKVASVAGLAAGQTITIDSGASAETVTITVVGTAGAAGTGITVTPALAFAHASGAPVGGATTVRYTTDGSTWSTGTGTGTSVLNAVACTSSTACLAVGASGTIIGSADGGATWSPRTSGAGASLNAITCPAGACYVAGAFQSGFAALYKSTDGGTTWALQASGTANPLSGIACANASACFADGTIGTVIATTDGGATWTQQGNPLSGPTTAINATSIALNGAACTSARCVIGTGAQGDIMTTPLLTVTVHATKVYGSSTVFPVLSPSDVAISYSPASEAANVTGSLTCSTTATAVSHVGTYTISACSGLADNGFSVVYDYANSDLMVTKAPQTITFGPLADKTYGDPQFDLDAFAPGGTVSFVASGNCTVTGVTVFITGAGSCSITASQPGNSDVQPAPDVTQSFAIHKADQSINFGTLNDGTFGDADFNVDATATSGLVVSLHASGPCTLSSPTSPANVHISGAGSCSITASQAGNDNYNPAPNEVRSFSISKAPQHITFGALADKTYGDPDFDVSATASSGLSVSFGATGNCTVSGVTVHITGGGSCSITASQGGNGNYDPAGDVTQSFAIHKADQTITFDQPADHTYGDANFGVSPSASSKLAVSLVLAPGGACTLTGTTVHIVTAGSCSLTASQVGDSNYNAAGDVTRTFAVHKANQTITFAAIPDKTWGDADFSIAPTAGSGLAVTVASTGNCHLVGFTVQITGAGSCSITASQAGDGNYNAAPDVTQSFAIHKADQSITFPPIADKTFGAPDFTVDAAASSRLLVSLSSTGSCTLNASSSPAQVHITASGSCTITASQAGNGNYNAAPTVSRSFVITNSKSGKADGAGLKPSNGGNANFHVEAARDGLKGNLSYEGPETPKTKPPTPKLHFEAKTITSFSIAADGNSAWFAGVGKDGRSFLVYVEDNSKKNEGNGKNNQDNGKKKKQQSDVFKLWIDGVLQTPADGGLSQGKIDIRQ